MHLNIGQQYTTVCALNVHYVQLLPLIYLLICLAANASKKQTLRVHVSCIFSSMFSISVSRGAEVARRAGRALIAAYKPTRTSSNSLCIEAETHSGTFLLLSLVFFFFKSLSWSFRGMDDKWRDSSSLKQQSKDKSGVFILILMIFDLVLLLSDLKQQSWAGTATSAAWPRANGWMMRSFSVRHRVRSPFGLRRRAAGSAKSRYNIYTLNRYFCSLVSFDYDLFT